ncbi:PhzF family phenazine biosynthesis protein [Acerihabitans sp. TG2]|uniref:PhzF family phenazine biosynthesis protein n=1 Tax=Acerihabitans sp. TG2 TaxID=3096008 RepID=UPI002B2278DE|nr:PhzF family phenazine biosynthesis protein [Acerihabitans sp. TG2]MEA9390403.1 PhzF family phenazine biosynthesis protein [Acerihabitans sp. TG2]
MTRLRRFKQVDVFTAVPLKGNPLAVILDAEGLTDAEMFAMARWTNLSETTFVLTPTSPDADYRVRIFTPDKELLFAGHPTLGTAYALLQDGLVAKKPGYLVQECGIGQVLVNRLQGGGLAFAAPPAVLKPLCAAHHPLLAAALHGGKIQENVTPTAVDIGINWLMVRMENAQECLNITADATAIEQLQKQFGVDGVAVYGLHDEQGPADYEVRAFIFEQDVLVEDPVTGSANACLAQLLHAAAFPDGRGTAQGYRVRQGTQRQRDGRVTVTFVDGKPWIGGDTCTLIDGTLDL